jgi:F420-dependent oxidoreductase-like protein
MLDATTPAATMPAGPCRCRITPGAGPDTGVSERGARAVVMISRVRAVCTGRATGLSNRMKLSTTISLGNHATESLAKVVELAGAGLDVIGVAEAYSVDAVSLLGYLAAKTEGVELMSAILPIYSRTPTLTAMTAAGIDMISGGRFILGLGASGPQVIEGWHGVKYDAPIGRTREVIEICRKVWRRERVEHDGRYYSLPLPADQGTGLGKPLKMINHPLRDRIPIYLASLGDKNVEMTAEIAEGWIPFMYLPELADRVWGDSLARGAKNRDPELGPLQIVAGRTFAIGKGLEERRNVSRPHLALYIGGMGAKGKNFYNDVACRYGFEAEAAEIQDLYLAGHKDEAAAKVPQQLIDGMTLIGDEGYVRDRLAAYAEAGVTMLSVNPVGPDPLGDLRRLRELVEAI